MAVPVYDAALAAIARDRGVVDGRIEGAMKASLLDTRELKAPQGGSGPFGWRPQAFGQPAALRVARGARP